MLRLLNFPPQVQVAIFLQLAQLIASPYPLLGAITKNVPLEMKSLAVLNNCEGISSPWLDGAAFTETLLLTLLAGI